MIHVRLVNYLMNSAITGGVLGATHGYWVAQKTTVTESVHPVITHSATGLFLGPWAPVALPIWMWNFPDPSCPTNPRRGGGSDPVTPPHDLERIALDGHF
jgi:hypothetical protein